MKTSDKLKLKQSERRSKLAELAAVESPTDEQRNQMESLTTEFRAAETQLQAAICAETEERDQVDADTPDGETRELVELRSRTRVGRFVAAAMAGRPIDGAEAEYSQAVGVESGEFPIELLAPEVQSEKRTTTDTNGNVTQGRWLDRLFSATAAMRVGVTFDAVAPGQAVYPVMTAGAAAAQRGRNEAAAAASWTVGATTIKPSANRVRAAFSTTDAYRLPGLEDALRRDLASALMEGIDRTIFLGDAGANEDSADIVGLTGVTGVTDVSLTQANKIKAPKTVEVFAGLVDGKHAAGFEDLRIIASVGCNSLWASTNIAGASAQPMSMAAYLQAQGLNWMVRGDIEAATLAGDWGAFIGRSRGIQGAAIAAIWESAMLVRDPYTGSSKSMIALTLQTQWGFALPRASNFARIKFAA